MKLRIGVIHYAVLVVICLVYLVLGAAYAMNTPEWQAPDEPAHYNVIAQVAGEGCCPVIEPGDWDSAYLEELKASGFPEDADITPIEYEDHQPPLYYLVGSLVYRFTGGRLLPLRLLSVVFGLGVVLAVFVGLLRLWPGHPVLALTGATFAAFLPQNLAIMASVNNDSLANLLAAIILVVSMTFLGNPIEKNARGEWVGCDLSSRPHAAALGGLLGVAIWTKLTIYFAGAVIVAAILLRWRREDRSMRFLTNQMSWFAAMVAVLGVGWPLRNILVYGWPDVLGQAAHNMVVFGQTRTAEQIAAVGFAPYFVSVIRTTFQSFWGQFGWMGVPMPGYIYGLLGIFTLIVIAGIVLAVKRRDQLFIRPEQVDGGWILLLAAGLVVLAFLYYNLTYYQVQGRYLFPGLLPIAAGVAFGLWGISAFLEEKLNSESLWLDWLPLLAVAWMPLLAAFALIRFIIPYLE